jgi:SAM-dependent methyltransferase
MTVRRTRTDFADLSVSWEAEARQWIQWARTPGHDSYWRFHRDQFLRLLPPPGRQTLDIGCGEGRLARDLKELGHRVVGIDSSPSLVAAAREFDPSMDMRLADATALPLAAHTLLPAFARPSPVRVPASSRQSARRPSSNSYQFETNEPMPRKLNFRISEISLAERPKSVVYVSPSRSS